MDPNTNLEQQRAMVEITLRNKEDYVDPGDALELIQLMADLDEWLTKGGFFPQEWLKERKYVLLNPVDKYGKGWPGLPISERCGGCGQPDNLGECSHGQLTDEQVLELGGVL